MNWIWNDYQIGRFLTDHNGDYNIEMDYIGGLKCGGLCFDLVEREYGDDGLRLDGDLYVADPNGYEVTKDGYPYVDCDGFSISINELIGLNMSKFKRKIEEQCEYYIRNKQKLIEKANDADMKWNF